MNTNLSPARSPHERLDDFARSLGSGRIGWGGVRKLAQRLGCDESTLSHILRGRRPGPDLAVAIEREVGIPMAEWYAPEPETEPEPTAAAGGSRR